MGNAVNLKISDKTYPGGIAEACLIELDKIMKSYEIDDLFILGDLFNKGINYDIRLFTAWRDLNHALDITVVKGNHDLFSDEMYTHFDIRLHRKYFLWNRFLFTHKPMDESIRMKGCDYIFCGEVNPGILLNGKARHTERMPCFYFNEIQCILPAFSGKKGKYLVKPNGNDRVYVITGIEKDSAVLKVERN